MRFCSNSSFAVSKQIAVLVRLAMARRIVKELERFDLSKTGDDIKGLAFERFLGNTFRGELGQFFTPRPVVNFMVEALDPREGELICDPAAGSGGFLIRAFEHVRAAIAEDVQARKDAAKVEIEALGLSEDETAERIEAAFIEHNRELLPSDDDNRPVNTRVGRLAWRCIFGTDADARPARTAKMNMIMHGDGHGGIHHHDGLVDVNGIFPGRFDVVLTNPPFGSNVGSDQKLNGSAETLVRTDAEYVQRCEERYGPEWRDHHAALAAKAAGGQTPILNLFEIGRGKNNRATEIVFVERCLNLLRPGGRMAIVLPDGNLNNPSLAWLRRWCEGKARIDAVVSLPEETFVSSKATVKASIVFLTAFTAKDTERWDAAWTAAHAAVDAGFDKERDSVLATVNAMKPRRPAACQRGDPPAYPRGIGATRLASPLWDKADKKAGDEAWVGVKAAIKEIDRRHDAALWAEVRERFDYPVFVASPKAVGITSAGDTSDSVSNDLPAVLAAYREFREWVDSGAAEDRQPSIAA
jgi:type I restriction enzyme M protein